MSEKPEALEVAADLRARIARHPSSDTTRTLLICDDAARCLEEQHAEIERLREALGKSLTHEQIRQIAASIDRSMPLESAKILFARRIEAALREEG